MIKKFLILVFLLLSGCIVDFEGLFPHKPYIPEHAVLITDIGYDGEKIFIFDPESLCIVDSIYYCHEWPELNDFEFPTCIRVDTNGNIVYGIQFKYALRTVVDNEIRVLDPEKGRVIKVIETYPEPTGLTRTMTLPNGHQFCFVKRSVVGENVVSVLDLTDYRILNEFTAVEGVDKCMQDEDGRIYMNITATLVDSANTGIFLFDTEKLIPGKKVSDHNGFFYNGYIFTRNRNQVIIYDTLGNEIARRGHYERPLIRFRIGEYLIGTSATGEVFKLNGKTLEIEREVNVGFNPYEIAYARSLNMLVVSDWPAFLLAGIDFDNFQVLWKFQWAGRDLDHLEVLR